jgi:hypothetical protein
MDAGGPRRSSATKAAISVTTDFRTVFAEVVRGHLGLTDIKHVFPGFTGPASIGVMG